MPAGIGDWGPSITAFSRSFTIMTRVPFSSKTNLIRIIVSEVGMVLKDADASYTTCSSVLHLVILYLLYFISPCYIVLENDNMHTVTCVI